MRSAIRAELLHIERLAPASQQQNDAKGELVLLHGWGSDSRIWRELAPMLSLHYRVSVLDLPGFGVNAEHNYWRDESCLLAALAKVLPEQAHIVGWSLGGNVAMAYAARYPQRVLSLTLVATNLAFVAARDWPHAMPEQMFEDFYRQAQLDTAAALRRFQQLQVSGDPRGRDLLRQLRAINSDSFNYDASALLDALAWLRACDQRQLLRQLALVPQFILGECDQLVPCACAQALARVAVMPSTAHVPMLSDPQQLSNLLLHSLAQEKPIPNSKQRIARSFSKAAASYDSAAELQRAVGANLLQLLPQQTSGVGLDLGSGTGFFLPKLRQVYNTMDWFGGDLAEGMLSYTKQQQPALAGSLIVMDAESLPLADQALQGIYSSLVLQWCQNLDAMFSELRRVIRPGACIAFSTLVEGTLAELKGAWQQVDGHVHVNRFAPQEDWLQAAQDAGLRTLHWQHQLRQTNYSELRELMHELKALGAHNVNPGMSSGLTGKRSWQQLRSAYEQHRCSDGSLPASWQVLYGVLIRD